MGYDEKTLELTRKMMGGSLTAAQETAAKASISSSKASQAAAANKTKSMELVTRTMGKPLTAEQTAAAGSAIDASQQKRGLEQKNAGFLGLGKIQGQIEDRTRGFLEATHVGAISDIFNLTGSKGLFTNPSAYGKSVVDGFVTDVKSAGRVMGNFFGGKWSALGKEAGGDFADAFNMGAKAKAKLSGFGEAAGQAKEGDYAAAAATAGAQVGITIPPEVLQLGAGAIAAYSQGGEAGLTDWAKNEAKNKAAETIGVDPKAIDQGLAVASDPSKAGDVARSAAENAASQARSAGRSAEQAASQAAGYASGVGATVQDLGPENVNAAQSIGVSDSGFIGKSAGYVAGTPLGASASLATAPQVNPSLGAMGVDGARTVIAGNNAAFIEGVTADTTKVPSQYPSQGFDFFAWLSGLFAK